MKILHVTDDLMGKTRLESRWKAAGGEVLGKRSEESPDLAVVDLTARGALERVGELRAAHPDLTILAYGPHVDGEAFKAARAAGASAGVARGGVQEKVLGMLEKGGATP